MPSKLHKKRKRDKARYASKNKTANANSGVPVSQNPPTNTDDMSTGINCTNWSFPENFFHFR